MAKKSKLRIKEMLHKALGYVRPHRGVERIHASEITKDDFCPRQWVLVGMLGRIFPGEYIGPSLGYTFDEGWMKQHKMCDDWLAADMFGVWKCLGCDAETPPMRRPDMCIHCTCENLHYEEMNFVHSISGASGGIDAFIQLKGEKLLAVECKILKGEFFKDLETPQAEHRVRTSMYLGIIRASNDPLRNHINTDYASLVYMSRGYGYKQTDGMSPFKEYIVERDDSLNKMYFSKAHAVRMSRNSIGSEESANLYPHGICENMFTKCAGKCMVAKECFGGKYPASITWVDYNGNPKHESLGFTIVVDGTGVSDGSDDDCPF